MEQRWIKGRNYQTGKKKQNKKKKQSPTIPFLEEPHFRFKDTRRLKGKRKEKDIP